jgi:tetratricopeptide (TPR) repeat protein
MRHRGVWLVPIMLAVVPVLLGRPRASSRPPAAAAEAQLERRILDQEIEWFRARVRRDPTGALDLVQLGARLMRRARASGQPADYAAAERAARAAIRNQPRHSAAGWQLLVGALMSQHRFTDALVAADSLATKEPESASALAVEAEVLLELGRYEEADRLFRSLWIRRFEPGVAVRVSRWLEVRGRLAEARDLLQATRDRMSAALLPRDQRAWFALREGELALKAGAAGEAARQYRRGLDESPDDGRLLAAMARLALDQGDLRAAIAWGDSALATRLDPVTLGTLAEAWDRAGNASKAGEYEAAIEATGGLSLPGFDRRHALALLDRGERIGEVASAAERELRSRRDIGTLDLVAWARFRSGRVEAAARAIEEAVRWNPTDRVLERHRAAIVAALAGRTR